MMIVNRCTVRSTACALSARAHLRSLESNECGGANTVTLRLRVTAKQPHKNESYTTLQQPDNEVTDSTTAGHYHGMMACTAAKQ